MNSSLSTNPRGKYRFLPGIAPYSCGVVAMTGFEVVRVRPARMLPWAEGMQAARRYVESLDLSCHCLCGFELRCPAPFSLEGFIDFNSQYRQVLKDWDMMVDGINPVARTNVAPAVGAPEESSLFAFSYVRPSETDRLTFVVAGGGELPDGELSERRIIRVGETSAEAMAEKADCVVKLMNSRMVALGAATEQLTAVDVYTVHSLKPLLEEVLIPGLPAVSKLGVNWYYTRPPIIDIEFEMDMRGVLREEVLDLT